MLNEFYPIKIKRIKNNSNEELKFISKQDELNVIVKGCIITTTKKSNKESVLTIYSIEELLDKDIVNYKGKDYTINNITYYNDYEEINSLSHYKGELIL